MQEVTVVRMSAQWLMRWEQYWKDLQKYTSAKGDAPYCWLVNVNHVYLAADGFDFGKPVVQPHGGRIFDNVTEWSWK